MSAPALCIARMVYGSHLYGTAGPASDRDFKGIFLPTREQILLQKVPKSLTFNTKKVHGLGTKNLPTDEDLELYSIGYFLELCFKGETVALDMLHAPASAMLNSTVMWEGIQRNRASFYTKNLKALVGYARRQAAKYGIKGSRLADAERVLEWLNGLEPNDRLTDHWAHRPTGEHLHDVMIADGEPHAVKSWDVCGRKLQCTVRVRYAESVVHEFVQGYGNRAKAARNNEGIDWKAVSHAFRAGYQVRGILLDGDFSYPLPQTEFIKAVKQGELDYLTEVAPPLDALLEEVEALSAASDLPEHVDRGHWERWLLGLHGDIVAGREVDGCAVAAITKTP